MPIDDGLGKELIAKFDTSMQTSATWYTDTLGQEMQKRVRNYRPTWNLTLTEPVACNYFPMNTAAYQETDSVRLTVVGERSRGMGSLQEGSMEFMLQRRLLHDDHKGVGEPLNETVPVRSSLFVQVNPVDSVGTASAQQRFTASSVNNPFQLFFGSVGSDSSWLKSHVTQFAPIVDLPFGVQLLTLRTLEDGQTLLRLSHIFAANEGSNAAPVTVDLSKLFAHGTITAIVETQLTANQPLSTMLQRDRLQWDTTPDPSPPASVAFDPHPINSIADGLSVVLHPLQIRTFIVQLTAA